MLLIFTNPFPIVYTFAIVFSTSRRVVFSLPQGAPCEAIAYNNPENSPRHLNHTAQLGSGPFAIDVYDGDVLIRDGVLVAGREYLVVIHGEPKGFLVRALNHEHFFGSKFKVLTDVGDFSTLGHSCAQKVDCREDGVFVTHNGNRCTNGPRIKIKYIPPIPDTGVVFRLNAVQDFSTFYNDIRTQKYTVIANPSETEPIIPSSFSLAKPFKLPDENADEEVNCKGDFSQPQQLPFTFPKEPPQQPIPSFPNNRGPNVRKGFQIEQNQTAQNPQSVSNKNEDLDHTNNGGFPNGNKLPGTAPRPSFNELGTGFENAESGFDRIVQPQPQPINLILPGGSEINLGSIPIKSNSQNPDSRGTGTFGQARNQANVAVGKAEVSKLSSSQTSHQPTRTSGPVGIDHLAANPNWNVPSFRTTQFKRRGTVDEPLLTSAGLATAATQCEGRADDFPAICDRMRRMDPSACHPSKAMAGRCMASCCSILKFMDQQISKGLPANPLLYNQPQG